MKCQSVVLIEAQGVKCVINEGLHRDGLKSWESSIRGHSESS